MTERHAGRLRRRARGADARDRILDRPDRHVGARRAVLQIEADDAGLRMISVMLLATSSGVSP